MGKKEEQMSSKKEILLNAATAALYIAALVVVPHIVYGLEVVAVMHDQESLNIACRSLLVNTTVLSLFVFSIVYGSDMLTHMFVDKRAPWERVQC